MFVPLQSLFINYLYIEKSQYAQNYYQKTLLLWELSNRKQTSIHLIINQKLAL